MKIRYILNILVILGFIFIGSKAYADENNSYDKQLDGIGSGVTNNIDDYKLYQNYPNPFNPTTISYQIPNQVRDDNANLTLKVYDVLGREIKTLLNEAKKPGTYEVQFDASELSSGIYFYTLKTGSFYSTKKMLLIK
ncbi:MAG: T9SS type A sorting domain-containing protein [Ignavibacteriae bacterium]|nr:T9SS type A sorting domain-containing protein [Ignavibacteriota bacterium]